MVSQDELRERVVDTVPDDIELFERGGEVYGRDDHGEFKLDPLRGTDEPLDDRCGWPCRYTMERYGQTRYCGVLPEKCFVDGGSEYCRTHKSAENLMERAHELFEHGYFATNYANFVEKLDEEKFLFAVEIVGGLFDLSRHDFEIEEETRQIDTSESDLIYEDSVEVSLPIPTNESRSFQANELWTAALKEVMTQNMQEAVFEQGMATRTLTDSADMEGRITDTHYEETEHHLHLPLSRLAKDIKEHLKNGGVSIDDDDGSGVTFQKNDYTLDVRPAEEDGDTDSMSDVGTDFHEAFTEEEVEAEAEIE